MKLSEIDKNLEIETTIDEKDIVFLDVREDPFELYGLYLPRTEKPFKRMPDTVAKETSLSLYDLNFHTAGGRVRFSTDSMYVALKAEMPVIGTMSHMTLVGSSGFDLYIDDGIQSTFYQSFIPPGTDQKGFESIIRFPTSKMRTITINFPLYNPVDNLYIGVQNSSNVGAGKKYRVEKPVLYYGSSITQGGCASRPGNSYEAIISRHLDCDHINFGFSGSGLAEDAIVAYMSDLDVSVFVCDYDHNAPDMKYLEKTHEKMIQTFRKKHPLLPIILISKPDFKADDTEKFLRRDVIYSTYIHAIHAGDKNIYFIDGYSLFQGNDRDSCTVDGLHPNDLGFYRMAETIESIVREVLSSQH